MPFTFKRLGNKDTLSKFLCIVSTILLKLGFLCAKLSVTHQGIMQLCDVSEIEWYCFEVVRSPLKCANHFCHIRHNYSSFIWLLKIATPCDTSVTCPI